MYLLSSALTQANKYLAHVLPYCYVYLLPWWMPCHFLMMAAEEFFRLKKNGKGPAR